MNHIIRHAGNFRQMIEGCPRLMCHNEEEGLQVGGEAVKLLVLVIGQSGTHHHAFDPFQSTFLR